MKSHLEVTKAPHDASSQEALPGVQERCNAIDSSVHVVADKCQELDLKMKELPHKIQKVTKLALDDFLMKKTVSSVTNVASCGHVSVPVPQSPSTIPPAAVAGSNAWNSNPGNNDPGPDGSESSFSLPRTVGSTTQIWFVWFGLGKH